MRDYFTRIAFRMREGGPHAAQFIGYTALPLLADEFTPPMPEERPEIAGRRAWDESERKLAALVLEASLRRAKARELRLFGVPVDDNGAYMIGEVRSGTRPLNGGKP